MDFQLVDPAAIREGRATDAYFEKTVAALEAAGRDPHVTAEVTTRQFPAGRFGVLAGLRDAAVPLTGFEDLVVDAIPEGRLFDAGPVLRIEGPYRTFCRYETALLGFLSHASGIATNALRARLAAPEATLLSFGARHVHPAMTPAVERSALIGGFDGFSHVAAGEAIGREAGGTMPHALVLCFGRGKQEAAWQAYAAVEDGPTVALVDTFTDETDEAMRAAEAIDLDGVRLDTTASRRGDLRHIAREVRWRLDAAGHEDVSLLCSGGLDAAACHRLRDVVDGFGVGGYVSNADPLDLALDIVAVDGDPIAKRGKLPGPRAVYRTPDGETVRPADATAPADGEPLLAPLLRNGEVVDDRTFDLDVAAARAMADADRVDFKRPDATG